jgi:hypothetical protein
MAVFNSTLYVAFRANDASNRLFVATSSDGVNFTSQEIPGLTMSGNSSPALVVSNNVLYYIYGANDTDHEMLVAASTDGVNWQGPAAYTGVQMGATGPAATAFPGGITVGFQSNDSRNVLFTSSKATEAATYAGTSDPNGPGPQDGFVCAFASCQVPKPAPFPLQMEARVPFDPTAFPSEDRNWLYMSCTLRTSRRRPCLWSA